MKFGDKLREQRKKKGLTQKELGEAIGVTRATLNNYERGFSHPAHSVYFKIAEYFGINVNYFLTEDEEFLTEAAEKYGRRGLAQAEVILEQAAAMFAGGELSEEDQIAFMHEMQGLFLDSKNRARDKFTPRKYKKAR
ncbi:MAG: helix-turn-helix domain-containing protein [Clostridiales bacterium]|jgi:transcriptional regulator with XRE-family HTH domain|nr:helix-turn-helix domain-containing protein [Clostridiales bacterium]